MFDDAGTYDDTYFRREEVKYNEKFVTLNHPRAKFLPVFMGDIQDVAVKYLIRTIVEPTTIQIDYMADRYPIWENGYVTEQLDYSTHDIHYLMNDVHYYLSGW